MKQAGKKRKNKSIPREIHVHNLGEIQVVLKVTTDSKATASIIKLRVPQCRFVGSFDAGFFHTVLHC